MEGRLTNPVSVMTSLVTLIFLTDPSSNSSSVHASFLSTGGGFLLAVDWEKKMGVVLLLLMFLDKEGFSGEVLVSEAVDFVLVCLDEGGDVSVPRGLF